MAGGSAGTVVIQIGLLLLASVLVPFQAPAAGGDIDGPRERGDSPWPTFHGDNARTGNTTEPGPGTNRMLWSNGTGQNCYSSPSVAGGKVFIGSLDGAVYCFNAVTGIRLWRTVTGDLVQSSPAVDMAADRLYIGSMDDYLYCLNATSGAQVWRSQAGGDLTSSPLLYDGKVYIGCGDWYNGPADGYLYCFDASNGARLWRTADAGGAASPALADGRLFTMSDNNLQCLDPQTGDHLWNASVGTTYYGSPAVAEGSVYCSAGNGHLYSFNASTGTNNWEFNSGFRESQCTPAVSNGSVYACFDGGDLTPSTLMKVQASDGTLNWMHNTQGNAWGAPTVTGGRVYFSNDRTVECLNISDGSHVWSYTGADGDMYGIGGCAALWSGRLYIGGAEAKLYCFGVAEPNRPPAALVLSAPNTLRETSLCLTWNASNEPDFARYEVHRSLVPSFIPSMVTRVANITSRQTIAANVSGLNYSTRYYFKVRVWDNGDPEMFNDSNEVDAVTATPNGAPAAVTLHPPSEVTPFTVRLSWSRSTDADFSRYELHRGLAAAFAPSASSLVGTASSPDDNSTRVTGLRPWTVYYFKVRTCDNGSPPLRNDSNEVSVRTGNTVPEAVSLSQPLMGSTTAALAWSASNDDDFARYELHLSRNASFVPGMDSFAACITGKAATEYTVEGLQLARAYHFVVRIVDEGGLFNDSAEVTGTTENTVPKAVISSPVEDGAYDTRTPVPFDASKSSDLDRDPLTFYWTSSIDGFLSSEPAFSRILSQGGHRITLYVNDGNGHNISARVNLDIQKAPDRPPVLSVLWPVENGELSGMVTFKGTASDPDGNDTLRSVEMKFGKSDWQGVSGLANWTHDWNSSAVANGKLKVLFRAFDGELYSPEVALNLKVNNVIVNLKPIVTISSPSGSTTLSRTQTVSGTARDPDGRVTLVELSLNGGGWFPVTGTDAWSYVLDTTELRDGVHLLMVRAFDGTNYSEPASLNITVKNASPAPASGTNMLIPAVAAVAVIAVVAALALLLMRRKRKAALSAVTPGIGMTR